MANRYRKKCSTSLIIKRTEVKIRLRYYFTLIRSVDEDVEKWEPLCTFGGNKYSHYGKQYGDSTKSVKQKYYRIQQYQFWEYVKEH